jgi:hypothetical protein
MYANTNTNNYSRAIIQLAAYDLEKQAQGMNCNPQVKQCVDFMKAKFAEIPYQKEN